MDKQRKKTKEEQEEEVIAQQITDSYQSGFYEPELDKRAQEKE
ncbi:hypothetical protein HNQ94_000533 [Salirhabdus euzebyi]|uniref:Uncharacterized protein n=1 Tax=Salirhabdus euzebyi TaxID=394506 RepID=A0A841Q1P9_9BACI|nr:hypothetical protein [Salirhabdus euzebyi]MBB6452112.1 hypothetical protein [Salirhabdus euzebyi]